MRKCMYQQNTSPKGCYYENKDHSILFMECKNANCYYKQLKRLQAENEELKEEITKLSDPRYQIMKVNEGYYNRMKTYKQALKEIREIAGSRFVSGINEEADAYNQDMSRIYNKIDEVLNENSLV